MSKIYLEWDLRFSSRVSCVNDAWVVKHVKSNKHLQDYSISHHPNSCLRNFSGQNTVCSLVIFHNEELVCKISDQIEQ